MTERTDLEAFEAEAAARHAETAVPGSPPEEFEVYTPGAPQTRQSPATLDALMAQMAGLTALLEQMAKDGAEMKVKVKALEAFVTPGADPWRPGLAAGSASRPADAGGRPTAPPGVESSSRNRKPRW